MVGTTQQKVRQLRRENDPLLSQIVESSIISSSASGIPRFPRISFAFACVENWKRVPSGQEMDVELVIRSVVIHGQPRGNVCLPRSMIYAGREYNSTGFGENGSVGSSQSENLAFSSKSFAAHPK